MIRTVYNVRIVQMDQEVNPELHSVMQLLPVGRSATSESRVDAPISRSSDVERPSQDAAVSGGLLQLPGGCALGTRALRRYASWLRAAVDVNAEVSGLRRLLFLRRR
jgi:hypothetical protein